MTEPAPGNVFAVMEAVRAYRQGEPLLAESLLITMGGAAVPTLLWSLARAIDVIAEGEPS